MLITLCQFDGRYEDTDYKRETDFTKEINYET